MAFYQSKKWILILGALVLFVAGCGQKKSTASLRFDFSSKANGALSTQIQHIFVNVSAPNAPVVVKEWDCKEQSCGTISIDLVPGANRLIQLLVVTEDNVAVKKLNYGDVTADLSSGDVSLNIKVDEIGNFNNEARVTGQYIPSNSHPLAGEILTGVLTMKVAVGNDKPPMKLMKTEMFAGWFNLFILDNIGFEYTFSGFSTAGETYLEVPLFDDLHSSDGLKISSSGLAAATNKKIHVSSTTQYMDEREGAFVPRNLESAILGFFGAANSKVLCADEVGANFIFDRAEGRDSLCKTTDAATNSRCTDYMKWSDISVTGPTTVDGSTNGCTGAANEIRVNLTKLPDGGQDMLSRFGPFKEVQNNSHQVIDFDSATKTVKWTINSGVVLPSGVEVFVRTLSSYYDHDKIKNLGDGILCEKLPNFGFSSKGTSSAASGSIALSAAEYYHPDLQVALCPKKTSGEYYRTAYLQRMSDVESIKNRNVIDFALYNHLSTIIPGFGFGGSGWANSLVPEMEPVDSATVGFMYVLIRNKGSDVISLSDFNAPLHDGGALDLNPGGSPNSTPSCTSLSFTLQPTGQAGDHCAIKVTLSPTTGGYDPGATVYSSFALRASGVGTTRSEFHKIDFAAPFYKTVNYSDATIPIDIYAPPGTQAVKVIQLHNDHGGGNTWSPFIPANFGTAYTLDHNCPAGIPDTSSCIVYLRIDNRDGAASSGTFTISLATDGSSASINSEVNLTSLSVNIPSPYNFGAITGTLTSPLITVTNNSGITMGVQSSSGITSPLSQPTDTCDTVSSIVNGSTCSFSFSVPGSYSPGFYRQTYKLPYEIGKTYRLFTYEATGGF